MNKAFVRELEATHDHCPRCGSLGTPVVGPTLDALLEPESRGTLGDSAAWCPFPTCEVAYFDALERTVSVDALRRPAWPKDPAAPICPCHGFACDEIDADLADGAVLRVRAHLDRAKADASRCATTAPDGQPCVAAIQLYYMRGRQGDGVTR
jgi:hypothetical protein